LPYAKEKEIVIHYLPSTSSEGPREPQGDRGDTALLLTHLGAAYNLARWLMRDETEAEDVVQEAYLSAISHFAGFRGGDERAWLLTIVRNSLRQGRNTPNCGGQTHHKQCAQKPGHRRPVELSGNLAEQIQLFHDSPLFNESSQR
jgi:hypothetical protein